MSYIPVQDCKDGYLYKLSSRNLGYGVYRKELNGFIGIRVKFSNVYLFTEYHWDNESFATAKPLEEIEKAPDGLVFSETLGTVCGTCKHPIDFNNKAWVHTDGAVCDKPYGTSVPNPALFEYLSGKEKEFNDQAAT